MYDAIVKRCKLLLYILTKMDHLPMIKTKEQKKMTMQIHLQTTRKKKEYCRKEKSYTKLHIIILHRLGL